MPVTTAVLPRPRVTTVRRRALAVLAAVLLLAAATVLANRVLSGWAYPACGAVTSATLVLLARLAGLRWAEIGLSRRHARRALLFGLGGFAVVLLGFGLAMAIPPLRVLFHDGRIGSPGLGQLVWLALVQNAAVGATFGGLPRIVVSLLAMLAAAGAGVFLCWWRYTSRGLLAPILVHLATNSGASCCPRR